MSGKLPAGLIAALALACAAAFAGAIFRMARGRSLIARAPRMRVPWGGAQAAAVLLLFICAQAAAAILHGAIFGEVESPRSFSVLVALIYVFTLTVVLMVLVLAGRRASALETLGIRSRRRLRSFLAGVWLFLLFFPLQAAYHWLLQAAWRLIFAEELPVQAAVEFLDGAGPFTFAALAFFLAILAPLFEEFIFRGFVQSGLEKSLGAGAGTALAVALFAVVHGKVGGLQVVPVAIALGFAYYWTRDLVLCIGFHFAVNFTSVVLVLTLKLSAA